MLSNVQSSVPENQAVQEKRVIFRAYQLIWYVLGVFETVLLFRFAFKILGANPVSPFVSFVYYVSSGLVRPFRSIFPVTAEGGSVFEWASVVAMVVYLIISWGLVNAFQMVKPVSKEEVEKKVDNV